MPDRKQCGRIDGDWCVEPVGHTGPHCVVVGREQQPGRGDEGDTMPDTDRKPECAECQDGRYGCGTCHMNIAALTDEITDLRAELDIARGDKRYLHAEIYDLRASCLKAEAERDAMRGVVDAARRIESMPTRPRPDGTYNYSRGALIDIAQAAMDAYRAARQEPTDD